MEFCWLEMGGWVKKGPTLRRSFLPALWRFKKKPNLAVELFIPFYAV